MLRKMCDAISAGNSENGLKAAKLSLEKGIDAKDILTEILVVWDKVADFYRQPHVEISEREEKELMRTVDKTYMPTYRILFLLDKEIPEASSPIGCVVVGCIKGEGHLLVKDVIALLLKASGYKVIYKLGSGGETPDSIIESIKKTNAIALLLSASQPDTFPMISETVEALKREGLRDQVLIVIGGRAVTEEISRRLDCDVYADHPLKGLKAVARFIKSHERKNS